MTGPARFLERLWLPDGVDANPALAGIYRANMVAAFFGSCAIGLGPFAIIAALVLRHASLGFAVAIAIVALSLLASAAVDGFRIRLVIQIGQWTRGKRTPVRRIEESGQFWTRTVLYALIPAVKAAGAVMLAKVAFELVHRIS